jgi:hypothetical protein
MAKKRLTTDEAIELVAMTGSQAIGVDGLRGHAGSGPWFPRVTARAVVGDKEGGQAVGCFASRGRVGGVEFAIHPHFDAGQPFARIDDVDGFEHHAQEITSHV